MGQRSQLLRVSKEEPKIKWDVGTRVTSMSVCLGMTKEKTVDAGILSAGVSERFENDVIIIVKNVNH